MSPFCLASVLTSVILMFIIVHLLFLSGGGPPDSYA